MADYDSTAETLKHSLRVGELMGQAIGELVQRSVQHDLSKTRDPELAVFNEFTPKLKHTTYGSDDYARYLTAMGEGLRHHYAANRHHPEHFQDGINDMTLLDLTLTGASGEAYELLCEVDDERHDEHEATLRWRTEPVGRVVDVPRAEP
jgi:hypothetical protein